LIYFAVQSHANQEEKMPKNLVIVESPAKAKTIEKFLGKDFQVESSYGHIRDLVQKDMGVDVANNFKPNYAVSSDKKDVVKKLKKLSKDAELVWLASDEDREGEAIAWHLYETLELTPANTNRITFSEITKKAIEKSIQNPRQINTNLVNAQQARRVLDRLVGFELSPILWKKVKAGLSAGRVQSVAVRLIVEREMAVRNFEAKSFFKVVAEFKNASGKTFLAELNKKFEAEKEALDFLNACSQHSFSIDSVETKPAKKSPAAPFTTSTLQQEAARKLYFSVSQTMSVAQKLYEAGLITYMRTDSLNLSEDALSAAEAEITNSYGKDFAKTRRYSTKSKGAQEAHEAIRPTYFDRQHAGTTDQQKRLYDLIWKRTVASQMSDAQLERTVFRIASPTEKLEFVSRGEVIKFEGFLKVYLEGNDDEDSEEQSGMLPATAKGESLTYEDINATQRFTKHPARFTEASLVKKLEELGIGRPSTYAPTISTIVKRQYVEKSELEGTIRDYVRLLLVEKTVGHEKLTERTGADKNKLIPTDIGTVVNGFLTEHFDNILDFNFTASVEAKFDQIAQGHQEWTTMLDSFYKDFHPHLKEVEENSERATGERALGDDPKSGKPIIARIGRYGAMIQIGKTEDEEKPRFASLRKGQSIDTISLEDALELFKLPRDLGEYQDEKVSANIGRFGPYVKYKSLFASIKEADGDDPMTITLARAIEIIDLKIEADKNKFIKVFDETKPVIEVLNGRYGPYLKSGRKNYKLPKDLEDPAKLTREEAEVIIAEGGKKKPAAKKAPAKAKKSTKSAKK
jgi:DNA topoisomerase-1